MPQLIGFNTVRITARIEADEPREVLEALPSHAVPALRLSSLFYNPVHAEATLAA